MAAALQPDVVLLDIAMPKLSGIDAATSILSRSPSSAILALTAFGDVEHVAPMIRAGARGYLLKDAEPAAIIDAIRRVARGETVLAGGIASALTDAIRTSHPVTDRAAPAAGLTRRETDVVVELTKGSTNKEIASALEISEATVKYYLSRISAKWHLERRVQIALRAASLGLVDVAGVTSTSA